MNGDNSPLAGIARAGSLSNHQGYIVNNGIQSLASRIEPVVDLMALKNPFVRRSVLTVAACLFVGGIWLSLSAQPDILARVELIPLLLLVGFAIPATLLLNAVEFALSARLIGQKMQLRNAMEITIVGSVANMLPLPGGTMMRIASLKAEGASLAKSTSATLYVAVIWFGVALVYSGTWLAILEQQIIGLALASIGIATLVASGVATYRLLGDVRYTSLMMLAKVVLVLVDASRTYLSLLALGVVVGFGQASVLALSSLLGASFSIVPAGLGVREGASALLGPVVGIGAASAFLAASLSRIVGMAATFPLALFLALNKGRR